MLFRAMSTADRIRAIGTQRPRNDVVYEIAFDGLLLLVLSTALILVAIDCAIRLRDWADDEVTRRKLIERYRHDHNKIVLSTSKKELARKL